MEEVESPREAFSTPPAPSTRHGKAQVSSPPAPCVFAPWMGYSSQGTAVFSSPLARRQIRSMNTAACPPSSTAAAPPPSRSTVASSGVVFDAREEERRRRVLLQAAIQGNLHLLAKMAVEVNPIARGGTGAGGVRSTCGRGALHLAAANGRTHVCRYLVQDLAIPVDALSTSGETPLLLAATFGHTATAAYLLERGAGPSTPDSDGETPLHWAAYNGDHELAKLLLSRGAGVGAANTRGTPLHVAAARAHPAVVDVLLRHGADPNKLANRVFTPLVSSLFGGSLPCMKLLIQAGANVNGGGFRGATPLLLACSHRGTIQFAECLLEAGADPNVPDELGRLPIEIAAFHGERELAKVLLAVTTPTMLDWSIGGITRHVNSADYRQWVREASCKRKDELKLQGNLAFKIEDYDEAILWYGMAMKFDDTDAIIYSNRSICWLRLGVGDEALSDAQTCIRMQPDWARGYYRQGMALRLLQDYAGASDALLEASKLDPENGDIAKALRDVSEMAGHVSAR